MGLFSSLKRQEKEAIGLLQIGTCLECFDLMLYVHMAVFLNELFFPPSDPHTASILAATAFCSTFIFRPIGALLFGWIGDHIGRKNTLVITTLTMAVTCLVLANLPTYAQIGITAAWAITICRISQGISSMGEVIGAQIYLTESIRTPARYPAVAFLSAASDLGNLLAIGVAFLVASYSFNWRIAFWTGAFIAVIGAFARKRLRETPEFLEMKRQWLKKGIEEMNLEYDPLHGAELNRTWKEPRNNKALLSYFLIACAYPLCFYLVFMYFNPILKENFGYSSSDILKNNLFVTLVDLACSILIAYLSYWIHPLKINKIRGVLGCIVMVLLPFLVTNLTSPTQVFLLQALILIVSLEAIPSVPVFLSFFPLYRRFTYASILFALSRALVYTITSFGLIYLSGYFGHWGLWVVTVPIATAYMYGIFYFERLERKKELGMLWKN